MAAVGGDHHAERLHPARCAHRLGDTGREATDIPPSGVCLKCAEAKSGGIQCPREKTEGKANR